MKGLLVALALPLMTVRYLQQPGELEGALAAAATVVQSAGSLAGRFIS